MIAVSILDNSIIHAHTYVIVVLCVSIATHEHLSSNILFIWIGLNHILIMSILFMFDLFRTRSISNYKLF